MGSLPVKHCDVEPPEGNPANIFPRPHFSVVTWRPTEKWDAEKYWDTAAAGRDRGPKKNLFEPHASLPATPARGEDADTAKQEQGGARLGNIDDGDIVAAVLRAADAVGVVTDAELQAARED